MIDDESKKYMVKRHGKEFADAYINYLEAAEVAMDELYQKVQQPSVMQELFDIINKKFGIDFGLEYKTITDKRHPRAMSIKGKNLATPDNILILAAWKNFCLGDDNISGEVTKEVTYKDDVPRGCYARDCTHIDLNIPAVPFFVVRLGYRYEHQEGGSNGASVCNAVYKDGKWDVRFDMGQKS